MHRLYWGRFPVNFNQLFTSVSQAHSHATCAATLAAGFDSQGKRSLKHLGPKIWDSIDPSSYISPPAFKRQLKYRVVNTLRAGVRYIRT